MVGLLIGTKAVFNYMVAMMMLVHHDDAKREFDYGAKSHIGTFSDSLMAEANAKNWTVISMKDDWKTIFPFGSK